MHCKYFFIMGLFSFLSFLGCSRKPAETTISREHGPFTIQIVKKTYKTFNMNYGWVNSSHGEYHILYKGKPIEFSENLQNNTGFSHLWQVYILEGTPYPTLIAGSQSLYMIREKNGALESIPLVEQGSDFGSLQYLDSENGQPGAAMEVFMSSGDDSIKTLKGGDYLLVSQHKVLHLTDMKSYPLNENNNDIDNYSFQSQQGAVAFSPDRKKIVFTGNFQTWNTNETPKYKMAMIVYDYQKDTGISMPFSQTQTRLKDQSFIDINWFNTYFEWKKSAEGDDLLQLKSFKELPRWQGFMRDEGKTYELSPVAFGMQKVLTDFILQKWQLSQENVLPGDEYSTDEIKIQYKDMKFSLWYRREEKELYLMGDTLGTVDEKYTQLINEIGVDFNAILKGGQHQELFEEY